MLRGPASAAAYSDRAGPADSSQPQERAVHAVVNLLAGAALLVVGRKLYWLFVAIAGFYVGIEIARALVLDQPQWVSWLIAAAAGIVGALVAMLFQRVAFALGGFYAGGYLLMVAAERFFPGAAGIGAFLVGGVLGAVAAALLMDWAIIVLSCMVGAALVVSALGLGSVGGLLVYAGLMAAGIVFQARLTGAVARKRAAGG
jgi:hypothetical protein